MTKKCLTLLCIFVNIMEAFPISLKINKRYIAKSSSHWIQINFKL